MSPRLPSSIEPLEARIAPAVVISNPLPDVVVGIGKTGTTFDLSQLTAPASSSAYHTKVDIVTNYDTDPNKAGIQAGVIELELYDDTAPLTVQNFLAYVNNANVTGDYDGTLFHRAVPGFVLQGGGYNASSPSQHIPVFPAVHNEPDAVNRSNTAGTIAMAKVEGDPNSATSEWFVNLVNNGAGSAADLDNSNGGFTVFGKVLGDGLTLANTIANLPKVDVGAGSETPAQNGVPIKIVDAKIIPGTPNPTSGLTYTVESVDPVGVTPANLVTAKISGSKLLVNYTLGKSGLAKVTVRASDGTTSASDSFTVEIRPNFSGAKIVSDSLSGFLVPGDSSTVKVSVGNSGGVAGGGTVNVFLTPETVVRNSSGNITSFTDAGSAFSIGSSAFQVANGHSVDVSVPVSLPNTPFTGDNSYYKLTSTFVPNDTPLTYEELYTDDNTVTGSAYHDGVNKFGTFSDSFFGTRTAVLKYLGESTDANPALVTWTMKGPGSGTIAFDAQGKAQSLTTQGTNFSSSIIPTIAKNGSRIALDRIDLTTPVGTAGLGLVDLNGPLNASAGIKSLTLGDVNGQSLLLIGAPIADPTVKGVITLRDVQNLSLQSDEPLTSITAASWLDTDTNKDAIAAPSLSKLAITGNFAANLTLSDETVPLTSVTVGGFLQNSTIKTAGDIGTVKLGGISKSNVFAGVSARPTSLADFADPHRISSFTIAGVTGQTTSLFIDSQVAAQTIGTIKVMGVATPAAMGAAASGFVADVIGSYARPGVATKTKFSAPTTYDDGADGTGGYVVTVL